MTEINGKRIEVGVILITIILSAGIAWGVVQARVGQVEKETVRVFETLEKIETTINDPKTGLQAVYTKVEFLSDQLNK